MLRILGEVVTSYPQCAWVFTSYELPRSVLSCQIIVLIVWVLIFKRYLISQNFILVLLMSSRILIIQNNG